MAGKFIKRKIRNAPKWICERPYYIRRAWDRKRIRSRDFTIISNNCWAGRTYQYLGMPYLSPTVGLYFFAEDYLRFVSKLHHYLALDLKFIPAEQSKYIDELRKKNQTTVPIGILDDVEIIFLHYHSEEEAREKWERRKQRINYDNMFIKFSKMNLCTEEEMRRFDELPFSNKFMLNNRKRTKYSCEIYWNGPSNEKEILSDTKPYPGNLKLPVLLNKNAERYMDFSKKIQ
ncbi:MAG: DUF1919 domain-containing protein [Lachnospiraceae bacterium]|nr:DUF1919 domain-containing protein [Lachnospiraceae bacterium]